MNRRPSGRGTSIASTREERLEQLFEAATALPLEQRAAFVKKASGEDPGLRAKLLSLLAHTEEAGDSLDQVVGTAVGLFPRRLVGDASSTQGVFDRRGDSVSIGASPASRSFNVSLAGFMRQ